MDKKIILGSGSARRREILSYFSLPFVQIPSDFDEDGIVFQGDPQRYAATLAAEKAAVLAKKFPNDIILTADTVVYFDGKVYNKPKGADEAHAFLRKFSGNWQHVYTGLTVQQGSKAHHGVEETKILFNSLSDEQIEAYLGCSHYIDRAGGFSIQQGGGLIVAGIEGCYYNVMGLPINTLQKLLFKVGIDLWRYLKSF